MWRTNYDKEQGAFCINPNFMVSLSNEKYFFVCSASNEINEFHKQESKNRLEQP